jgi:LemA protein
MEEDGILNARQAAMLRDSLAAGGTPPPEAPAGGGRHWLGRALGLAVVVLVVGAVVLLIGAGGTGDEVQDVARSLNQPGDYGQMNKSISKVLAAAILLIVPLLLWMWLHNNLVAKEERVVEAWAQTESNFQRRADLVPALIETVSRYLKHESETFGNVAEERSAAAAALSRAVEDLAAAQKESAELLQKGGRAIIEEGGALKSLFDAQAQVGNGMSALMAVAEDYPDLRSSDQFLELQAQLEGTENRINVARMRFNQTVRDYNGAIRKLPGSLVAGAGNFKRKAYFQSDEEARDAPDLNFN